MTRRLAQAAVVVPLLVFVAVYVSHAGHGFILDDYGWVLHSRARNLAQLGALFNGDNGFFRPMVAISFAVNEWMFGARPLGYGLTNVALALACAAAVFYLARACTLSRGASALAALLWLMNFHFTKTAILWISGRTALIATLAAVLTAANVMRGRLITAFLCLTFALFSREDTVLLPIVILLWLAVLRRQTGRTPVPIPAWTLGSVALAAGYLAVRSLTPATAHSSYVFTFNPEAVLRNIGEYADRTSTLAVAALGLAVLILGRARVFDDNRIRALVFNGLIWLVVMLGFAFVLPVRSNLYAALPSVGICLAVAATVGPLWSASTARRRQIALVAVLLLSVILTPVYWTRSSKLTAQAEFSTTMLDDLERLLKPIPAKSRLVVYDVAPGSPDGAPTLSSTLGVQINEAYELRSGRRLNLELVPTSARPADGSIPIEDVGFLPLVVKDGRLRFASPGAPVK